MNLDAASLASLHFPAGVLIGIAAAAPVGPINLLVIQRALCQPLRSALAIGVGAAIGDGVFAVVAAFGVAAAARLLDAHEAVFRLAGGAIMLAFAVWLWRAAPHIDASDEVEPPHRLAIASLTMTLTNPATLLFFAASFGAVGFTGIGHDTPHHLVNSGLVVAGTMAGSMLWWLLVTAGARRLRGKVADRHLILLNHGTAVVLGLCGLAAMASGIFWR